MDNTPTAIEMLVEKAENYAKTSIELVKLNAVDKGADVLSTAVAAIAISLAVGMFLMLASLGLAIWIGELLGNTYLGFFAVAAFYLLLAVILKVFKQEIVKAPICNLIINEFLKEKVR